ncbi:MAG: S41 family peptidase [Deinococcales bacterium]
MKRSFIRFSTSLILALISSVCGQWLSQDFREQFIQHQAGRSFIQVYDRIHHSYVDVIGDEALLEGAIRGMLSSLGDPYTRYLNPEEVMVERQLLVGSYEGVGIVIAPRNSLEDKLAEVIAVYQDSVANKAGIRVGDVVVRIDGADVTGLKVTEINALLQGTKGSSISLSLKRPNQYHVYTEMYTVHMLRENTPLVMVESLLLPNRVGYLKINNFYSNDVYQSFADKVNELIQQGAVSLILDLRDNPGGLINQGILVANDFLSEGDIVFQRSHDILQSFGKADEYAINLPLLVLINHNTASTSEILAAALQDNRRAVIIGEPSLGKGVGQILMPLSNGGQLVEVTFEWLTPNKQSVHKVGIQPDIYLNDRREGLVNLKGQGAPAHAYIEVRQQGKSIGTLRAKADGSFEFIEPKSLPALSAKPGEAIVNLQKDFILKFAYDYAQESLSHTASR